MRFTVLAPSSAVLMMISSPCFIFSRSFVRSSNWARPRMPASVLLKSCATPEASSPSAESFSSCENCSQLEKLSALGEFFQLRKLFANAFLFDDVMRELLDVVFSLRGLSGRGFNVADIGAIGEKNDADDG